LKFGRSVSSIPAGMQLVSFSALAARQFVGGGTLASFPSSGLESARASALRAASQPSARQAAGSAVSACTWYGPRRDHSARRFDLESRSTPSDGVRPSDGAADAKPFAFPAGSRLPDSFAYGHCFRGRCLHCAIHCPSSRFAVSVGRGDTVCRCRRVCWLASNSTNKTWARRVGSHLRLSPFVGLSGAGDCGKLDRCPAPRPASVVGFTDPS
jgi:hypothetical protein